MKPDNQLPVANRPRIPDRRAQCTHTTMKRVFDCDGSLTCPHCGDSPDFGWIYACTEDEHRNPENALVTTDDLQISPTAEMTPVQASFALNGWVVRANKEGHYTEEQVKTLKAQRERVLATARVQEKAIHDDIVATRNSMETAFGSRPSPFAKWITRATPPLEGKALLKVTAPKCRLKLCHFCFLAGCDRSWLSLNKACSDTETKEVPFKNIYEIPSTAIARMPFFDAKRTANTKHISQPAIYNNSHGKISNRNSEWNAINGEEKAVNTLENQQIKMCEAHLRISQYWSHIGLHQSLLRPHLEPSATGAADTSEGDGKDNHHSSSTEVKVQSKPKRPRLLRRPKWTRDMMLRVQMTSIINNAK